MLHLKEGSRAEVVFHEGKPLSVELPSTVELEVKETEPGLKGATAAAQMKPAVLETGLKAQVPPFVNPGETVVIDTRSGEYVGRAGK